MSFAFNGTGIWVYGVTIPTSTLLPKVRNTLLSITLDGVRRGDFTWRPSQDSSFHFDTLFFGQGNLGPEPHTLTVSALPDSFAIIDRLVVQQECASSASSAFGATDLPCRPVPSSTASDGATQSDSSTGGPSAPVIRARGLSQTTSVVLAVVIPISVAFIAVIIIYFYLRARWRKEDAERRRSRMLQNLPPQKPRSAPVPVPANYLVHSGGSDSRPSAHIASYHSGGNGILAAANRAYGAMHSVWPWAPSSHEPSNIAPEEAPRRHRSRSAGSSTNFISVSRRGSRHVAAGAADAGPSNYRDSQLPGSSRRASRGPWPNNRLSALVSALPGVHETPRTSPSVATSVSRAESAGRVLVAPPPRPVEVQRVRSQQRYTTESPQPGSTSAQPPESSRPASDPSSDAETPLTLLAAPRDNPPIDEETLPSSGIMTLVNALGPPAAMAPTSPPPVASSPDSFGRRVSRPLPVPPGPHPPNERPITSGPRVGTKQ